MPKIILFAFSLVAFFFSQAQHTQKFDTLSRKEIKELLLNQNQDEEARKLWRLHRDMKALATVGYTSSAVLFLLSRVVAATAENVDNSNPNYLPLFVIIGGSVAASIASKRALKKWTKSYEQDPEHLIGSMHQKVELPRNTQIRDEGFIYSFIGLDIP